MRRRSFVGIALLVACCVVTAYAADQVWFQFVCTKCGQLKNDGQKFNTTQELWEKVHKSRQEECFKCKGLMVTRQCAPPG